MNEDPASLSRLHDLVVPAPAPWWPPAPGWIWLLGLAAAVAAVAMVRWFIRRQRNRYRREALAELARLEAAARGEPGPGAALLGMAEVLKRTALTAFSREQVAALTGSAWFTFLDRTGGTRFADGLGAAWEQVIYRRNAAARETVGTGDVAAEIRAWIRNHQPC